jgi:hypothetical protein
MSGPQASSDRAEILLRPESSRVIARPFLPGHELPSRGWTGSS